jgi:putative sterol carrier protein
MTDEIRPDRVNQFVAWVQADTTPFHLRADYDQWADITDAEMQLVAEKLRGAIAVEKGKLARLSKVKRRIKVSTRR